jgi:hypothetical protein
MLSVLGENLSALVICTVKFAAQTFGSSSNDAARHAATRQVVVPCWITRIEVTVHFV